MLRKIGSLFVSALLLSASLATVGCEEYVGAPRIMIDGLEQGTLSDAKAPLRVLFDTPIDPATLKLYVIRYVVDEEGNLANEDEDESTVLDILYAYDGSEKFPNTGGKGQVSEDGRVFSVVPEKTFPIAEKLALVIEPGLADAEGLHATAARERIIFTYTVKLNCAPSDVFVSGAYYFLGDVTKPIATQVQLLAWFDVDPDTGEFTAALVNADRNRDPERCKPFGLNCDDTQACRTLPEPACVQPSEKAITVDEYPDYIPNYEPPTGYAFETPGCVDGQSGEKTFFVNVPVDVVVQSPAVTLSGTVLTATFEKDADGVVRGGGTIVADQVFLGSIDSGKAEGTLSARSIPPGEEPPDLKKPEPKSE